MLMDSHVRVRICIFGVMDRPLMMYVRGAINLGNSNRRKFTCMSVDVNKCGILDGEICRREKPVDNLFFFYIDWDLD